jgi:hypothetical protein
MDDGHPVETVLFQIPEQGMDCRGPGTTGASHGITHPNNMTKVSTR